MITFSAHDQMLMLGSELMRADVAKREGTEEDVRGNLERALAIIDLVLKDEKWSSRVDMLLGIKELVAQAHIGAGSVSMRTVYDAL